MPRSSAAKFAAAHEELKFHTNRALTSLSAAGDAVSADDQQLLREVLTNLPQLAGLANAMIFDEEIPTNCRGTLAHGLFYLYSEFDLVPDLAGKLPGNGFVDDFYIMVKVFDQTLKHPGALECINRHWSGGDFMLTLESCRKVAHEALKFIPPKQRVMVESIAG